MKTNGDEPGTDTCRQEMNSRDRAKEVKDEDDELKMRRNKYMKLTLKISLSR